MMILLYSDWTYSIKFAVGCTVWNISDFLSIPSVLIKNVGKKIELIKKKNGTHAHLHKCRFLLFTT